MLKLPYHILFFFIFIWFMPGVAIATDISSFGLSFERPDDGRLIVLPIFLTEGDIPNKAHLLPIHQVSGGHFIDKPEAPRNHPDKVAHVVLQMDGTVKLSGALPENLHKDGIFNYSYGGVFNTSDEDVKVYDSAEQSVVDLCGYEALKTVKERLQDGKVALQLFVKSAGNDFYQGDQPNTYDPVKFDGGRYVKYIDKIISKFGSMGIICSQMNSEGTDLRASSSRPLRSDHAPYYLCCPSPLLFDRQVQILAGTSFSAPMVSGLASRMYRDFPRLNLQDIRNIILISCAEGYLRWYPQINEFYAIHLTDLRFGKGLLSCENAYMLANLAAQAYPVQGVHSWQSLHQLYEDMDKQVIIYPEFQPESGITTYKEWLRRILPNVAEQELENILFIMESMKVKSYARLDFVVPELNRFFLSFKLINRDYEALHTATYSFFYNQHGLMRPLLEHFYSSQGTIIRQYVKANIRKEVLCKLILSTCTLKALAYNQLATDRMQLLLSQGPANVVFDTSERYLEYFKASISYFMTKKEARSELVESPEGAEPPVKMRHISRSDK